MTCYFPMKAAKSASVNDASGKRSMTFNTRYALIEGSLSSLPCGRCIGCRLDRADGWGIRMAHEAHMFSHHVEGKPGSSFLTLTYAPEHLPTDNSIRKPVLQKFVQDLRNQHRGQALRFYGCGEYGSRTGRAHYHVVVFGTAFLKDRTFYCTGKHGHRYYRSETLSKAWPYGNADISDVSYSSARYVAGYVTKKISGDIAAEHYYRPSPVDGEFYSVEPEFSLMSLHPGLGASFFKAFKSDIFPADECIVNGRAHKVPRFYDNQLSDAELLPIKRARMQRAAEKRWDTTRERLHVRHECKLAAIRDGNKRDFS